MGKLCLTFDNMGSAQKVGQGLLEGPGADDVGPLGYPELLQMLLALDIKATFFLEGWNAIHNVEAVREIDRQGHEVALHGWAHEAVGDLSEAKLSWMLSVAVAAFEDAGFGGVGFRAPGGRRGPYLLGQLCDRGFAYDSSIDHLPGEQPEAVLFDRPYRTAAGLPCVPWRWRNIDYYHYAMKTEGETSPAYVRRYFTEQLDRIAPTGETVTFIFHAWVSCLDAARRAALEDILRYARDHPDIQIVTAREAAATMIS